MDEKKLKEVEELLTGAEQDIEAGKADDAKAKIAAAKEAIKENGTAEENKDDDDPKPLPGTGSNGHL